jgi:hypothetical protein
MGFKTHEIKFTVFECEFCGRIFLNERQAKLFGCTEEPIKQFKVGDVIWAYFTLGAGMSAVGQELAQGKITTISKPRDFKGPFDTKRLNLDREGSGSYNADRIFFPTSGTKHDWLLEIKPLSQPETGGTFFLETEKFYQKDVRQ